MTTVWIVRDCHGTEEEILGVFASRAKAQLVIAQTALSLNESEYQDNPYKRYLHDLWSTDDKLHQLVCDSFEVQE